VHDNDDGFILEEGVIEDYSANRLVAGLGDLQTSAKQARQDGEMRVDKIRMVMQNIITKSHFLKLS
jgi:hypothetical protein